MEPGTRVRSARDKRLGTITPQARWLPLLRVEWDDGEVTYDAVDFLEVVT